MKKTILITGATDGIGLETAKLLAADGHDLLIHGRSPEKLAAVKTLLSAIENVGRITSYVADLSDFSDVKNLVNKIKGEHSVLDVLINNAGVFKTPDTITSDGLDSRFVVNTIAPYFISQHLLPLLANAKESSLDETACSGRIINLSSAAQAPLDIAAFVGDTQKVKNLSDMEAYAQSKLAITMWSHTLAEKLAQQPQAITVIAVNPGSLLASKMVKEGFGLVGNDLSIGAKILNRMALEPGIEQHSGQYFDNDSGQFAAAHLDVMDKQKSAQLIDAMEQILTRIM
ncbi:oxidoreductase [Psychrosphaera saromensis]|uniref:Oxidoreductase n=1 Tax=Psychrosphaera saromensis TaxID=716813 RepID=A0A2S7UX05_9GAMM|nr:SDR family NAD(P)-dependent oxidoreductase [Psychrosphaera saromensis]PQJ54477.1 oxidoreductase [Psychrosphaera saromensis]GHB59635.1 oxidoreductase [Psychrosphaera saromensis]GLQ14322.1 oxidoreductase [Psychrosphaera saromensis]